MKAFSSLAAVMGLWLGVSFLLWLSWRLFRKKDGSRQRRLCDGALALIDEGTAVFAALRFPASQSVGPSGNYVTASTPEQTLREDVRALLNAVEAKSDYFDRVTATKKRIQAAFEMPDFPPLTEVLQIRRDFWAASEIFLMEDMRNLGPELADAQSYQTFRAEARALLFKERLGQTEADNGQDPVDLRLAIAREEAAAFRAEIERAIAAELEQGRFPTAGELVSVPWSILKGAAVAVREASHLVGDMAATARTLARAMSARGLKGAAEELRRTRSDLPGQFATAFERAGGLARKGGDGLKRHYEFVLEAQELRARYAEFLSRAPDLSEKGKQFLKRLELERRAEQVRASSGDAFDWSRQQMVLGIAYLIAGLQFVQAKITPPQNKQLVARPSEAAPADAEPATPVADPPLRVLLLPSSAYAGGNHGRGGERARRTSQRAGSRRSPLSDAPQSGRLRDGLAATATTDQGAAFPEADVPKSKPSKPRYSHAEGLMKTPFKDILAEFPSDADAVQPDVPPMKTAKPSPKSSPSPGGQSLLDRLSTVEMSERPGAAGQTAQSDKPKAKAGKFRLFGASKK